MGDVKEDFVTQSCFSFGYPVLNCDRRIAEYVVELSASYAETQRSHLRSTGAGWVLVIAIPNAICWSSLPSLVLYYVDLSVAFSCN